jgi:hypothetical protein
MNYGPNLQRVHHYLKDLESPEHFITWNYVYAVASALGRKVWQHDLEHLPIFHNIYLLFVGEPAVGKSIPAIMFTSMIKNIVGRRADGAPEDLINISPDSTTLESLFQQLSKSTRALMLPPNNKPYAHASMSFIVAEELGTLFREKSGDLVRFLTQGYNCGDFKRTTKTQGNDEIRNMCINLLGCCTPEWIRSNCTNQMVEEGFTSRVIALYGDKPRQESAEICFTNEQKASWVEVKNHLINVAKVVGELELPPDVKAWREDWVKNRKHRILNPDRKLKHYYGRKKIMVYKLAGLVHFMEHLDKKLTVEDHEKALSLLESAEPWMHRALASSGDNVINKIAEAIKMSLDLHGPMVHKRILIDHFHLGDEEQIARALSFLSTTEQVRQDNDCKYQLVKKEEK